MKLESNPTPENQPDDGESMVKLADLLLKRLERISADSTYAHKASGLRGALLRELDLDQAVKKVFSPDQRERLSYLIQNGFHIIEKAAREMRDE